MISVYNIKPHFQRLLEPVLQALHKASISANQITWASLFLSLGIAVGLYFAPHLRALYLLLPLGLFVRMALNALDGMMARKFNQCSPQGELLNEIGDVCSDALISFSLLCCMSQHALLIALFIFLATLNEFVGVLPKAIGLPRRYEGPMGKSDRAFMLGLYGLLVFFSAKIESYAAWMFALACVLMLVSSAVRIKRSLQLLAAK